MALTTLKRRAEFQRVRGGGRWSGAAFVLEGKARAMAQKTGAVAAGAQAGVVEGEPGQAARFGFTVTKKLGGAVLRNRIRRRLKAAVQAVAQAAARSHFDYVVIARNPALDRPFASLKADLEQAFARVHAGTHATRAGAAPAPAGASARGRGRAKRPEAKQPEKPSQ